VVDFLSTGPSAEPATNTRTHQEVQR
jgi:hypothetical protein